MRQNALVTIVTNPQSAAPLTLRLQLDAPAQRGVPISARMVATGGAGGNVFSTEHTSLPDGLSLDTITGEITGTPTTVGRTVFKISVQDSASTYVVGNFSIDVVTSLTPGTVVPVPGEIGIAYEYTLSALGATGAVSWAVLDGNLPAGLSIVGDDIAGTPSGTAGISYATLQATDAGSGDTLEVAVAITIVDTLVAIGIDQMLAPVGGAASVVLPITGGLPPFAIAHSGSDIPAGLRLLPSKGRTSFAIAGIAEPPPLPGPSGNQDFLMTFTVTDALGASDTMPVRITVIGTPNVLKAMKDGTDVGASAVRIDFQGTAIKSVACNDERTRVIISPQATATSVLGCSGAAGDAASIQATTNDRVLARVSGSLSWVQVTAAMLSATGVASNASVFRGDGTWATGVAGAWSATQFNVSGLQVVGARVTGFSAATGTADKTTYATYAAATIGATYNATVQGQLQAALNHVQVLSQQLKAMKDAMIAHGLVGT